MMSFALEISSIAMIPSLCAAWYYGEDSVSGIIAVTILTGLAAGFAGHRIVNSRITQVKPRICYMTTLFTWLMLIAVSVLVYYFSVPGYSVSDALFEATASWTTTGIGAYDMDTLPKGLQLWRSTCSWLGGIGIILIALSVFPARKFVGWNLASTEFPGPTFLKNEFPFRTYYRRVVTIYASLTLIEFILLTIAGMDVYTALLTALSGISTAGLLHINDGVITALSLPIKWIITVFALLGSVSAVFFMLLFMKRFREAKENSEVRFYLWRIAVTAVIITCLIKVSHPGTNLPALLGEVLMQVISFLSTSGYIVTDFSIWTPVCVLIILLQMFVGACSLSTGGGIKISRVIIALKTISYSIYRHIHPSSIRTLMINKKPMKSNYVIRANLFIALFMLTYIFGALLLSFGNMDLFDSLVCSQAMITNAGTSLSELSASGFAGQLSPYTKTVMCFLMLAGRLEIYPLLMVFFRTFWKSDSSM